MTNILPIALGVACAVFLIIGIRLLRAPEARKECYCPARATVSQRVRSDNQDLTPHVVFQTDGKTVSGHFRTAVPRNIPCDVGSEIDILYCHSRVLFIDTYTVVLDDGGRSMQKMIRYYRWLGMIMISIGLLLILPIVLILKK